MLKIDCRSNEGIRLHFEFADEQEFVRDINTNEDCMSDHEILLVTLEGQVLYSSLGKKVTCYDDTLRTMDVYDWFKGYR